MAWVAKAEGAIIVDVTLRTGGRAVGEALNAQLDRQSARCARRQVAQYTRAAEQKRLARSAIDRLTGAPHAIKVPNRFGGLGKTGAKINEINSENEEWRARKIYHSSTISER